jgi:hypothetical protein
LGLRVAGIRAIRFSSIWKATTGRWPASNFAGIVVTNYLWRPRLPDVLALLAPGGVLIYETFMLGNEAYGKPSNPDFLLRPGELRETGRRPPGCAKSTSWKATWIARSRPCVRRSAPSANERWAASRAMPAG